MSERKLYRLSKISFVQTFLLFCSGDRARLSGFILGFSNGAVCLRVVDIPRSYLHAAVRGGLKLSLFNQFVVKMLRQTIKRKLQYN